MIGDKTVDIILKEKYIEVRGINIILKANR
jgi:hypothetical protein